MDEIVAGTRIAERYVLNEKVGSGGFGETWRAHDDLLDLDVAMKFYYGADPSQRERYVREARSLARYSQHQGIVSVRDLLFTGSQACLIMDYVVGIDLLKVISTNGRLDVESVCELLIPVADALTSLHKDGLLHRDVSPDNIRVRSNGTGVLLDFGSVLDLAQQRRGTIVVKPGYAPIEQYGDAKDQGPWTDVYALAATAYQCLCGVMPVDSLQRSFTDTLKKPSELGVVLPPSVEAALMNGLAIDYRKRMQSVGNLMLGLRGQMAPIAADKTKPGSGPEYVGSETRPRSEVRKAGAARQSVHAENSQEGLRREFTPEVKQNAVPAPESASKPGRGSTPAPGRSPEPRDGSQLGHTPVPELGNRSQSGRTPEPEPGDGSQPGRTPEPTAKPNGEPAQQNTPKHNKLANTRPSSNKRWLPIALAVAAILAVVVAIVVVRGGFNAAGSANSTSSSFVSRQKVTDDIIKNALSDDGERLFFSYCEISDEQIKNIAKQGRVKSLTFSHCTGFTTLAPLSKMSNLESLDVSGLEYVKLEKLFSEDMPQIESLTLSSMDVASGEDALGRLSGLTYLNLSSAKGIKGGDFLKKMEGLRSADLSGVDFSEDGAQGLAGHESLSSIYVNNCNLPTLEWVKSCPSISSLAASNNGITDLSPLSELPSLYSIDVSDNNITSLEPLAACENLNRVEVGNNAITTLKGFEGKKRLTSVFVANNKLEDASALLSCRKLEWVGVAHNNLHDLSFCESLTKLEALDASHNHIEDISKLASAAKMKVLALNNNKISDVSALTNGFTELAAINLAFNELESVKPLEACPALAHVAVNDNKLKSLEGMDNKPVLETLLASNNQIADISALSNSCGVLGNLDLGGNKIQNIEALGGLMQSKPGNRARVALDHNEIKSIDALPTIVKYDGLVLYGNPLSDFSTLLESEAEWGTLYLPYAAHANYGDLSNRKSLSSVTIVDVPYNKQVQVERDMQVGEDAFSSAKPRFLTSEEADGELKEFRDKMNKQISGATSDKFGAKGESEDDAGVAENSEEQGSGQALSTSGEGTSGEGTSGNGEAAD